MTRFFLAVFFTLFASLSLAQSDEQTLPDYSSTTLNDFAGLLSEDTAPRVEAALAKLKSDHDIEMTVVTLESRHDFGHWATMERFATALFNKWGVGDAERNDGIMVLVLRGDREMRIELGMGYNRDFDWVAQKVIDEFFLPRFREDDYSTGIEAGVNATIREIALPMAEGRAPDGPSFIDGAIDNIMIAVFAGIAALMVFGRWIGDRLASLRRCPNCGRRGTLRRARTVLERATRTSSGRGFMNIRCTACDYTEEKSYTIPRRRSSSSSGSFGGGSSSGGGASGRW